MMQCTPGGAKTIATCSLPHPENEHHGRANYFYFSILANSCVALWKYIIYDVMAAFQTEPVDDIYVTPA
jgi:hypothetical protein